MFSQLIGDELNPLLVIDNFSPAADTLVVAAQDEQRFALPAGDYYPGIKATVQCPDYATMFEVFRERIVEVFGLQQSNQMRVDNSCYAIANTPADKLLPIQSIPHFDTCDAQQLAAVHYLCNASFGGTSFYQHRATGFEAISADRSATYQRVLGHQATSQGLPPCGYINGSTPLFKKIAEVEVDFNRVVIYRSSVLHSGNIRHLSDRCINDACINDTCIDAPHRVTITSNLVFR